MPHQIANAKRIYLCILVLDTRSGGADLASMEGGMPALASMDGVLLTWLVAAPSSMNGMVANGGSVGSGCGYRGGVVVWWCGVQHDSNKRGTSCALTQDPKQ